MASLFVHYKSPKWIVGHIVRHPVALAARQQDLDGSALFGILPDVIETQAPETAVGVDVRRGHKVGVVSVLLAVARIPCAVFGPPEARDSGVGRCLPNLALCGVGALA